MGGGIAVLTAVVHVHVDIRAHPMRRVRNGPRPCVEIHLNVDGLTCGRRHVPLFESALEAVQYVHVHGTRRHVDPLLAMRMEIVRLYAPLAPVEGIVRADPGIRRCVEAARCIRDAHSRGPCLAA